MKIHAQLDVIVDVTGTDSLNTSVNAAWDYLADQGVEGLLERMSFLQTESPGINVILYPDDTVIPGDDDAVTIATKPDGSRRLFGPGWSTYHRA